MDNNISESARIQRELHNKYVKEEKTCIVCKKNKVTLETKLHSLPVDPLKQHEDGMWNNGTVERISFGYGSRHDLSTYYIAVCDDCIEEAIKAGVVENMLDISHNIFHKDGFLHREVYVKDERDKNF
jgi:hypothetical protein